METPARHICSAHALRDPRDSPASSAARASSASGPVVRRRVVRWALFLDWKGSIKETNHLYLFPSCWAKLGLCGFEVGWLKGKPKGTQSFWGNPMLAHNYAVWPLKILRGLSKLLVAKLNRHVAGDFTENQPFTGQPKRS